MIDPAPQTSRPDGSTNLKTVGVVVLGPGRSGTSAIARAFVVAGFFAGEVLGAAKGNPLGHFEPLPVLDVNEALLAELGCSWWADFPDPQLQLDARERFEPRLRAVLEQMKGAAGGAPLVVKEPRINSLLPLWGPVLDGLLHPVLAIRDPLEVALSHARRDGTSRAHALAAWEVQMAMLLQWLDGRTVTVAPYEDLVANPARAAELVSLGSAHLAPTFAARVDSSAALTALDPNLRHEAAGAAAHAENLTYRQSELWEFLRSLPFGEVELAAPAALQTPSEAAVAAVGRESERVALAGEHEKVVARLGELNESVAQLEGKLEEERNHLAAVEARHATEVAAIFDSLSWRITAPLRRLRRLVR